MKKTTLLKTMLLLCALVAGSGSVWAETIYSWNGNGSTTTANETGGTAEAKGGNSNIVVGASQKGNWCLKMNKGFSNTYYIEITLNESLLAGDVVTIGAFRTGTNAAVLGVDFGTTATQKTKDDTDVLASNGTPTDWEFEVPAGAVGSNKIRLYRNSGSTGMWVSKVVVTRESSGSGTNATWTLDPTVAIVTEGQNTTLQLTTNYDGALNFTSSDTNIATVTYNSSSKVITVNGIATGSTTISVTGGATATYNAINKIIPVTVKHTELVSATSVVITDLGYTFWDEITEAEGSADEINGAQGGVSIKVEKASGTAPRADAAYLRFYKNSTFTISVPAGCYITKVVFTEPATGAQWAGGLTTTVGDYVESDKTWYATTTDVNSLVINGGTVGTNRIGGVKVYINGTISATISDAGYATFISPFAVDFSATSLEVYTAKVNAAKTSVTLTAVESKKVPANTAVILKGSSASGTIIASADALENNDLAVSDGNVKGDGSTIYALAKKNDVVGFYLVKSGESIPNGKAYLTIAGGAGAPEFLGFSFGGTTAIKGVEAAKAVENGAVFNLNGQRVAQPTKGLYIVNGRKVVIK